MYYSTEDKIQFSVCFILFLIWFLCLVPVRKAQKDAESGHDNNNPREQYKTLPGTAQRALYAHNNLNEGFVWFGFSILANKVGGGNEIAAAVLALIYLFARLVYVPAYIFDKASIRSAAFLIGFLANFGLFIVPFASSSIYSYNTPLNL
ncbi:hypothetical protein K502DRAFT_326090 [Neoconidiobolus thromboides FSU 785]|nr:hypothetical protein K502DRAFT_326090 [Neoconidiobolus thromboides FSU 785]